GELLALSELLLQRRIEARDAMLAELVAARESLERQHQNDDKLVAEYGDRALLADRNIDRTFWLDALCDHVAGAPPDDRRRRYRYGTRRISATHRAPHPTRQNALSALAARLEPLD